MAPQPSVALPVASDRAVNFERRFHTAYRDVDAVVVELLWDVWRHTHDQRMRAKVEAALGQLQAQAEVSQFGARRRGAPSRGPVAVPDPAS